MWNALDLRRKNIVEDHHFIVMMDWRALDTQRFTKNNERCYFDIPERKDSNNRAIVTKIVFEKQLNIWKCPNLRIVMDDGCSMLVFDWAFSKVLSCTSNVLAVLYTVSTGYYITGFSEDNRPLYFCIQKRTDILFSQSRWAMMPRTRVLYDHEHEGSVDLDRVGVSAVFPEIVLLYSKESIRNIVMRKRTDSNLQVPHHVIVIDEHLHVYAISLNLLIRAKKDIKERVGCGKIYPFRRVYHCSELVLSFRTFRPAKVHVSLFY
jgi:hypothetical protein